MNKGTWAWITLGGMAVLASWAAWAFNSVEVAAIFLGSDKPDKAGPWGDSFGPFSALFSALAFLGVVITLYLQSQAIKRQQLDYALQVGDQHRQRFEDMFFQLLDMLRAARSEVRYRQTKSYRAIKRPGKNSTVETGAAAFRAAMFELRHWLTDPTPYPSDSSAHTREYLGKLYLKTVHTRYESTLSPYFRLLYTILWRLREDKILTADEKIRYGNLLRGHLTSFEVGMAGFNGLIPQSNDFSELITEFRLLKYHPAGVVREALSFVYPKQAFEGRDNTRGGDLMLETDPLDVVTSDDEDAE